MRQRTIQTLRTRPFAPPRQSSRLKPGARGGANLQHDNELTTALALVAGNDLTVVQPHDFLAQAKSEAAARGLWSCPAKETFEEEGKVSLRDSRTVVRHAEYRAISTFLQR